MDGWKSQSHKDSFHGSAWSDASLADEKDAFARSMSRMMRRLREHDWRPVQYRDALAATAPARIEEELEEPRPRSRMLLTRPGNLSNLGSEEVGGKLEHPALSVDAAQELIKEWMSGAQSATQPTCSSAVSPPSTTRSSSARSSASRWMEQEPALRTERGPRPQESNKEQELQTELNDSRRALEKMAHMLHDREEQLRLAESRKPAAQVGAESPDAKAAKPSASSPPESTQSAQNTQGTQGTQSTQSTQSMQSIEQAVRERAKCEVLRAELAERDVEIQRLRASERATEKRAAEELRSARLELAETRRQQEPWGRNEP